MATNWNELMEGHEIAYLRADICLSSPQSYSLDEKKRICEDMDASTNEVDSAMKADFESLPFEAQNALLSMLCASGCMTLEWWHDTLLEKTPNSLAESAENAAGSAMLARTGPKPDHPPGNLGTSHFLGSQVPL